MNRSLLLVSLVLAIWTSCSAPLAVAQFNGFQVSVDQFGNDILFDAANEPSIAVDPNDPNRIAIGWRQFDSIFSDFRQAGVAHSTDGGQTWTANVLDPGQFRSDPVLDFDADGNFYYSSLSSLTSIEVFKSGDGGASWSAPVPAFGGDKQWIAVDRTGGPGSGNIYQHWNVQFTGIPNTNFTRSTNGGLSFESSITGPFMKWGTMDVAPDGTLYMAGATLDQSGHLFAKSTNAQNPLATPSFSTESTIWLGGETSAFGSVNPSGLLGQVSIATDHSQSSSHGNVYVLGSVDTPGSDPLDVMFIRSTDDGETWSDPIRVNNDNSGTNAYQWFGTMSVAPNGRIDAIWNDTRNDASDSTSELFYAYSYDAGETWLGNIPMTTPFDQSLGYPSQNKLGDYYDMISDDTGAYLAYAATFNGGQDVYFLKINAISQCDFDADGFCGIFDLNSMLTEGPIDKGVAVMPGINDQFDLTGDGFINLDDRDEWLSQAAADNALASPYKLGDANLDGIVDGIDFLLWNEEKFSMSLAWDKGDFNGDGIVDGSDFLLWNGNKFTASDGVSTVPEPTSGLYAMLIIFAGLGRRQFPRRSF